MSSAKSRFSTQSPEVTSFLTEEIPPPADRFANLRERLGPALDRPDGAIPEQSKLVPFQQPAPGQAQPQQPAPSQQIDQSTGQTQGRDLAAGGQLPASVIDNDSRKVGRPLEGKKPKVEKTFAIDPEMHRMLIRISNNEGLRLDRKFSVSGVMQHLLMFALQHVEDDKVFPGPDGFGLELSNGAVQ
jgi:hypothetical protein